MVEVSILPVAGVVTGFASGSVSPVMLIVLFVARVAVLGCALVAIGVAFFAGYIDMFTFQLEGSQTMIKFGWFPGFGSMTDATLRAKPSGMRIVLLMARFTRRGRGLQIRNCPRIDMTSGAGNLEMCSCQSKTDLAVVELTVAVNAIVTSQAVAAEFEGVGDSKCRIERAVTIGASLLVENRNAVGVAIAAGEESAIGLSRMPGQGETGHFVREVGRLHNGQVGPGAYVFRMAILTGLGTVLKQDSVQGGRISQFPLNLQMTNQAQFRHALRRPEWGVTLPTVFPDLGMGSM